MRHKKLLFFLPSGGLIMMSVGLLLLWATQPVNAQCGSQASSCKNCHEVQEEAPVNADGTGWHVSHAFGDFCYLCHAGNPQATELTAAHLGLVPPLSDVEASCQQCHSDDLSARAQVYATTLNIDFGTGVVLGDAVEAIAVEAIAVETSEAEHPAVEQLLECVPAEAQPVIGLPVDNQLAIDDPNLVDYVQRYNEITFGERPVNVGNIVLVGMIGMLTFAGGGYVLIHEIRLSAAVRAFKQVDGSYPEDVVEMLPALARLKYETRKSLRKLVQNPKKTDAVLGLVNTLDAHDNSEEKVS